MVVKYGKRGMADEASNLGLGAIFIPSQAASSKDDIISAAFQDVAPEGDVKTTAISFSQPQTLCLALYDIIHIQATLG